MQAPIFLSWSGPRSRSVAELLRRWLPDVIQLVEPFMSEEDIAKGTIWFDKISDALKQSSFGIVCITAESQTAQWLMFEAGAMCKEMTTDRVCPLCINLRKTDVVGPLSRIQAAEAYEKEDMWKLVKSINEHLKERQLKEDRLRGQFDRCWKDFDDELKAILVKAPAQVPEKRSSDEMIEEILELTRAQSERLATLERRATGNALARFASASASQSDRGLASLMHHLGQNQALYLTPQGLYGAGDPDQAEPGSEQTEKKPPEKKP